MEGPEARKFPQGIFLGGGYRDPVVEAGVKTEATTASRVPTLPLPGGTVTVPCAFWEGGVMSRLWSVLVLFSPCLFLFPYLVIFLSLFSLIMIPFSCV